MGQCSYCYRTSQYLISFSHSCDHPLHVAGLTLDQALSDPRMLHLPSDSGPQQKSLLSRTWAAWSPGTANPSSEIFFNARACNVLNAIRFAGVRTTVGVGFTGCIAVSLAVTTEPGSEVQIALSVAVVARGANVGVRTIARVAANVSCLRV